MHCSDPKQKTIEGDLFQAFVAAGAISKANADDPKKSSLVRCARTDKGVHAAGNIISMKLIIEDPDIVEKINQNLCPQIRVWGLQRTTGSFSCYQACDSRWYEYLIPTCSFLPPHPSSFLGRKVEELADRSGEGSDYRKRQEDVANFWTDVEKEKIAPLLQGCGETARLVREKALHIADFPVPGEPGDSQAGNDGTRAQSSGMTSDLDLVPDGPAEPAKDQDISPDEPDQESNQYLNGGSLSFNDAVRKVRQAYLDAAKQYRISPSRKALVQETLALYVGTKNFHNYTVQKNWRDPSAKRHIKSFQVAEQPIVVDGVEWLSLKVHGQSFMMHQIRKMVGLAALMVRCGTAPRRISESFGNVVMRIPKAPGLGLLLERPVFDSYNENQAAKHGREKIDFAQYSDEIAAFKQQHIHRRIFCEDAENHQYGPDGPAHPELTAVQLLRFLLAH